MSYTEVTADDGGRFKAYVAVPPNGRKGAGVVLIQEIFGINANMRSVADSYAADGYTAIVPDLFWRIKPGVDLPYDDIASARAFGQKLDVDLAVRDIAATGRSLSSLPSFEGRWGVVGFCMGGRLAFLTAARAVDDVACAVSYYGTNLLNYLAEEVPKVRCPIYFHFGADDDHIPPPAVDQVRQAFAGRDDCRVFVYRGAGHAFAAALRPQNYDVGATAVAKERTMHLLRRKLGPMVDLDSAWEQHLDAEFKTGDANAVLATMTKDTRVLMMPTPSTGGTGSEAVFQFYKHRFIPDMPKDFCLKSVSRTIGSTQVVDEFIIYFTHDIQMQWLLPGVSATGRKVQLPMVAIAAFVGDKIKHEHVYWDQASLLVQVGLLDPKGLPVVGTEAAQELL